MAAQKWVCKFEAQVKLHSGMTVYLVTSRENNIRDCWSVAMRTFLRLSKKDDAAVLGVSLLEATLAWSPLLPAIDVPN
jgi:hypothetical protein